jgi:hypothetical protein
MAIEWWRSYSDTMAGAATRTAIGCAEPDRERHRAAVAS